MASISPVATSPARPASHWTAHGALLATALIWGVNVPLMKIGLTELHPFAFNALRLPLSAVLLGVLVMFEKPHARQPLDTRTVLNVAVVGLLGSLLYQVLFVNGLARTTAASVGFIIASAPLWTAVIARTVGVERIGRRAWIGLALAAVGAATITLDGRLSELGGGSVSGNLLMVAAMFTWAGSTVFAKTVVSGVSPTLLAFLMTAFMVPIHVMLGWPYLDAVWADGLKPVTWFAVAFSGLLSTGWSYAFWYYGVRHVGPSHTAVYASLVPAVTLIGAVTLLAEMPTSLQIAGGVLVLGGVAFMQRFRQAGGSR